MQGQQANSRTITEDVTEWSICVIINKETLPRALSFNRLRVLFWIWPNAAVTHTQVSLLVSDRRSCHFYFLLPQRSK